MARKVHSQQNSGGKHGAEMREETPPGDVSRTTPAMNQHQQPVRVTGDIDASSGETDRGGNNDAFTKKVRRGRSGGLERRRPPTLKPGSPQTHREKCCERKDGTQPARRKTKARKDGETRGHTHNSGRQQRNVD